MSAFQVGEWETAHAALEDLEGKYEENPELTRLRREIDLRRQVEQGRVEERESSKRKLRTRLAYAGLGLLFLLGGIYTAYNELYPAINQEIEAARRQSEASSKFRNSQGLLQAGRAGEALALLEEVSRIDPGYPGLENAVARAEELLVIENMYWQAQALLENRKYSEAQLILEDIQEQNPNYRDVAILIEDAELKTNLAQDLLSEGLRHFQDQNWEEAINSFEESLLVYPEIAEKNFQDELFYSYVYAAQQRLEQSDLSLEDLYQAEDYFRNASALSPEDFNATNELQKEELLRGTGEMLLQAYVNKADTILEDQPDSAEALDTAVSLFGRALLIDESNREVRGQYDLAKDFLLALERFQQQQWEEAIEVCEPVIQHSPGYANDTARQLLFEAHEYLAEEQANQGMYQQAVISLQEAVALASEEPNHALQYFDAQIRLADVLGQMEQYEEAVTAFQDAIEQVQLLQLSYFEQQGVRQSLLQAQNAAFSLDYQQSYSIYRDELLGNMQIFLYSKYIVVEGDYLLSIAGKYGSTTFLILAANDMELGGALEIGSEIDIPIFEE